jgi:uncharacterized protein
MRQRGDAVTQSRRRSGMDIGAVRLGKPEDMNVIVGQSHFIKTVEDIHEALAGSSPHLRFGIAFCEASGPCLIRRDGNDELLIEAATGIAQSVAAGHSFVIVMLDAYPLNVLNAVKGCQEVCRIFCATANPVEVVVADTPGGKGILGVIDGSSPAGVETENDARTRREFLRKIGYKR